ncbi:MAG: ComF family protein, partial [Dehalococcoidales bacterium]|nr:ComF family protein [Dehalococcoidales bacterium]
WCIGCGREGQYICNSCLEKLPLISPPICAKCGRPLTYENTCPGCIEEPVLIDGIRAPFFFQGVIRKAVHELKYRNLKAIATLLADLLHDYLLENPVPGNVLVPVPIHGQRLRERGYNQSSLVTRELGRKSGMPVIEDCLVRRINTPPQVRTISAGERRDNIAGAFACSNDKLKGKQVILVDDVSTSGATLNTCAEVLKEAGATSVWGLTIALEI